MIRLFANQDNSIKIMKGPSNMNNKKQFKHIKHIISYEKQISHIPAPTVKPTTCKTQKYAVWTLEQKVEQVVGSQPHSVRWIGNAGTAYLQAYAYIMLIGSGHSHDTLMEFKEMIYKLSRKYLSMAEQKLLVEFLCLMEYSQDKHSFLGKYPQIEGVLIKILQELQDKHRAGKKSERNPTFLNNIVKAERRSTLPENTVAVKRQIQPVKNVKGPDSLLNRGEDEVEQIYNIFNSYFKFIKTMASNEFCFTLQLFNFQQIHVVVEKHCYFIVELAHAERSHSTLANQAMSQLEQIMKNQDSQIQQQSTTNQKLEFDHNEFEQLYNFQRNVLESSVRFVEHGEQIKTLANSSQQKQKSSSKFQTFLQKKNSLQQIGRNLERVQDEHSFIDDLLIGHSEVPIYITPRQKTKPQKEPAKTARIQQSMKGIMSIKEELKKVRSKIEDKIRKLDGQPFQKNGIKTALIEKKTSLKHIFQGMQKEKRANSHSGKVPDFLKNGLSITERHQDYKFQQQSLSAIQDKERVKSMLVNSPSSSNAQQIEEGEEERDTIRNLGGISNPKYPQMNHSPTNFNLSVNVSINENTNRAPNLLAQHSSYPLTPIPHGQHFARYPSQFFNPNQFGGKNYPVKQVQYNTAFPKPTMLRHDSNPEGTFFSKLKKVTYPSK